MILLVFWLLEPVSCPCPGEVPHSNNTTLVLPTSLTPQHSHERLISRVDITAQPQERLMPYLMRLGTTLLNCVLNVATVTCLLAFFELLEAPGRVQALLTVLLRLATTTTEVLKLALYCHVFLVGVVLSVSTHMRTRYVRARALRTARSIENDRPKCQFRRTSGRP